MTSATSVLKWVFLCQVSGETPASCVHHGMINTEGHVICQGTQPAFLSILAAVFSTYYTLNLQHDVDAACTLEFIQRLNAYIPQLCAHSSFEHFEDLVFLIFFPCYNWDFWGAFPIWELSQEASSCLLRTCGHLKSLDTIKKGTDTGL